jgi:hypothetical protein
MSYICPIPIPEIVGIVIVTFLACPETHVMRMKVRSKNAFQETGKSPKIN